MPLTFYVGMLQQFFHSILPDPNLWSALVICLTG